MHLTLKLTPEDIAVEEALRVRPGPAGPYAVYRVTKRLRTTPEVQEAMARQLGIPPGAVVFPALKDRRAVAIQHCTLHGRGPARIQGDGFAAEMVGCWRRHLRPTDLAGNRFLITLRSLLPGETRALQARLDEIERNGLPNYFDEQRFGSYTPGGVWIGKAILQGDAEGALRAYLAQPVPGDPPELRTFKAFARQHWGDWPTLFQRAPRSNHRSVITYLKDHPTDFRRAVNLITPRLLPLLLAAYQSFLWNRTASRLLERRLAGTGAGAARVTIAGEQLLVYRTLPGELASSLRRATLPLPSHRATYADPEAEAIAQDVLAGEGLTQDDLKARILQRAYLPMGTRPLLLFPSATQADLLPGGSDHRALRLAFFLPSGAYATLVVKALAATT